MKKLKSLSSLLRQMTTSKKQEWDKQALEEETSVLQLKMLRIQQGIFHRKDRVVIIFEGFDAAGKGGAIRKLTEVLDPRSLRVIPIAAPTAEEQGTHWLYRFWKNLPPPGHITIFDRSWYGRVLVEKVEALTPSAKLKRAYEEINQFEAQLQNDGIQLIKIFLAITKDEQLERFDDRLKDPYKQWKITLEDIKARKKWDQYVKAVDELLSKCNPENSPWYLIAANSKKYTRKEVLKIVTEKLIFWERWIERAASKYEKTKLAKLLHQS